MKPVVCFGEIMLRLSPPDQQRLRQAMPGRLETTFAGAEVNVAVAVAMLGGRAEFVTALPTNPLAEAGVAAVRATGVGVDRIVWRDEGRLGLYFVEAGAGQRGGLVVYDREGSTYAQTGPAAYAWDQILAGAGWLHTTGIAAGVSAVAAEATLAAVTAARQAGVPVSCDLNFRRKLWRWAPGVAPAELARRTLRGLLPHTDLLIGNPADLAEVIGAEFDPGTGPATDDGRARHEALARRLAGAFPQLRWVAMTLRQSHTASHHAWGALLLRVADGQVWHAPAGADGGYAPYQIEPIVDRIGTGDAFAGALILALQTPELAPPGRALAFATAAGCLAHSVPGDFLLCSRAEVEQLMAGVAGGQVAR